MKFYKIVNEADSGSRPHYEPTRALAIQFVKDAVPKADWHEAYIDLVRVDLDQATIAMILSGNGCQEFVEKTWKITPRGGLKEETFGAV